MLFKDGTDKMDYLENNFSKTKYKIRKGKSNMNVSSLDSDIQNGKVSWIYNKNKYEVVVKNLIFANVNEKEKLIYTTSGKNYCEDTVYFYSYKAKLIMSYSKDTSQVCLEYNENLIIKHLDYLNQANIYKELDIIIVLTRQKNDKKLMIYHIDGGIICEKREPKDYYFSHLTSDGDKPAIVCDGDEKTKDKYGRSTWKFSINSITGELIKLSLAY